MNWIKKLFKRKRYTFNPDYTVRPSQSILEAMEFSGITLRKLWGNYALSWMDIAYMLSDEKPISMTVAVRLSKIIGGAPEFWYNLSKNYHDKKGGKDA